IHARRSSICVCLRPVALITQPICPDFAQLVAWRGLGFHRRRTTVSVQRLFTTVLSSLGLMLLAGVACHDMAPAVTGVPRRSGLIAFQGNGATSISSSNNTYFDIFVVNPDGSRLTNLTKRAGRNLHPAWSPDGSMIAFYADAAPAGLHLMKANGTGLRA